VNGLDLFTGIGGISLALRDYVKPIAYCEIDPYCQSVLLSRMQEGDLPKAPIWDDISTLTSSHIGNIDIITGGSPCQDFSVAGHGKGLDGERSGLFFDYFRLVREMRPTFVFFENVKGIRTRGLETILKLFANERYDCRWTMLQAAEVGAIHRRERLFLLAYDRSKRRERIWEEKIQREHRISRCENERRAEEFRKRSNLYSPKLCRSSDGLSFRLDRTHSLVNSVCPLQTKIAFERLMGLDL
jgi:DNA (cytosine-5)-methyltransferase 1